jgi:hypothetical protein
MSWQFPDESVYENFQNIEGCEVYPTDDGYEPIVINDKDTKQLNKAVGYNNTNVLRLYNSYCSDANHKVYPVLLLDDFAEANEVPKGSSGWYIPSPLELAYIDEAESIVFNDGDYGCTDRLKNINAILGSLRSLGLSTEGINYWLWSSSEYFFTVNMSVYYLAMIVNFGNGHFIGYSAKDEFQNNYARAICAF